jgi:hypothetical protein
LAIREAILDPADPDLADARDRLARLEAARA